MGRKAHFKVDPKLAELLGENYRSTEEATKELIDTSYAADSENVEVFLPEIFEGDQKIIVKDDGSGMKENEVRQEYLKIANSRRSRKGALSILKKRSVKGRKGIGKFAGLMVANQMMIETCASGKKTTLVINKDELSQAKYDLEKIPLEILVEDCQSDLHGTTVTLEGINQKFFFQIPKD